MEPNKFIQTELASISPILANMLKVNVFTIPTNYFEGIETTIIHKLNNTQVPLGYFNNVSTHIIAKIKNMEQLHATELEPMPALLTAVQHINVFKVPANYFDELPITVEQKINNNIDTIFEVLKEVNKNNTLLIPAHYFENLPQKIIAKATSTPTKIIKISAVKHWYKYAAAAIFTGILSFGIIKFNAPNKQPILEASIETGKNMDDNKFNETLNNLNAEDIAQYLAKTSTDADITSISTSIEENNVPAKDDYLQDENTLENFLNDIEPIHSIN
jgi:hypothetical protein